jgi:hypothetical protein
VHGVFKNQQDRAMMGWIATTPVRDKSTRSEADPGETLGERTVALAGPLLGVLRPLLQRLSPYAKVASVRVA